MPMLRETMLKRLLLPKLAAGGGGSLPVEDTATGNPLTFQTDLARPLKSLLIPFTPVQSGTGDPSPENVRPIVPWNGLKVFQLTGVNHWDEQWETGAYNAAGNPTTGSNQIRSKNLIPVEPETEYYLYINSNVNCRIYFCRENGSIISYSAYNKATFTTPAECKWLKFHSGSGYGETYTAKISVNYPATETGYVPFETETDIVFPSPVYGGEHEAVSGKLLNNYEGHVTTWGAIKTDRTSGGYRQGVITFENEIPVSGQSGASGTYQKCNIAKYQWDDFNGTSHFYTAVQDGVYIARILLPDDTPDETEIVVIAKMKTPTEQTLTGHQITALKGDNTIWSDADGSMTAVYLKKG